jgi:hypothetical protein
MENEQRDITAEGQQALAGMQDGKGPPARYVFTWRSQGLAAGAKTIDDMIAALEGAADALRVLKEGGVALDAGAAAGDDACLLTTDPAVAERFGFLPEAAGQVARDEGASPPARAVVKILYAEDETGPAALLGDGLARVLDMPVHTDAFWRDDVVRLEQSPAVPFPRVAEVVFTRHDRRSRVEFFGGEGVATLLMNFFSLLRFDSAVVVPSAEGRPGVISVAHVAGFDPAEVVRLVGADEPL